MQYDHGFSSVNQNIKLNEKTIGSNITSLVYNGNYATVGQGDGRIMKNRDDENQVTVIGKQDTTKDSEVEREKIRDLLIKLKLKQAESVIA